LLLWRPSQLPIFPTTITESRPSTYSDFHALPGDELHAAHGVLFHLDELRQLLGEVGSEGTGGVLAEGMAYSQDASEFNCFIASTMTGGPPIRPSSLSVGGMGKSEWPNFRQPPT
jgi:hypothetical protein